MDWAWGEFIDFISKTMKIDLSCNFANCNYFVCLNNGSTDSSAVKQELIYALFLNKGTAKVQFLSVESKELE